jgi:alpha-mannosidase
MNEYDDFTFTSSQAAVYEWIEQHDPELFAEIRERVKEGRWVLCGGWWVQSDCNLPDGESFVRQGLYGQRYFMDKFGAYAVTGYNVDSFGHHAMLPQLLHKCGLTHYVFMRPMDYEKKLDSRPTGSSASATPPSFESIHKSPACIFPHASSALRDR